MAIAAALAWLSSRTTAYTITDKRVTMRVGIVLNLTFNLPFARIAGAGFRKIGADAGDIPLTLAGTDQIAFLHLWPHARPWRIAKAEPMLRCVPHAEEVARVLGQAWSQSRGLDLPAVAASAPAALRQRSYAAAGEPRLTQGV